VAEEAHGKGRGGDDLADAGGVEEREEGGEGRVLEGQVGVGLDDVEGLEVIVREAREAEERGEGESCGSGGASRPREGRGGG